MCVHVKIRELREMKISGLREIEIGDMRCLVLAEVSRVQAPLVRHTAACIAGGDAMLSKPAGPCYQPCPCIILL